MHTGTGALSTLAASHVLLIKPSSLGDVVQTLPVLGALRHRFPRAQVTWLVAASCRDIVSGHPDLDEVIERSDRIAVFSGGVMSRIVEAKETTVEELGHLIGGEA